MEANSFRVVVPVTLRQQVADKLREAIGVGHFVMGKRLVERELCELMQVSRSSIREALRQLETEGLVAVLPNKGPIVAPVSPQAARDIYDLRIVLEGLAARLFAARATEAQRVELADSVDRLEAVYENFDSLRFLRTKAIFYEILLAGAGNPILAGHLRSLHIRVSQLRSVSLLEPGRGRTSIGEIRAILAAIMARDEDAAWQRCTDHVRNAAEVALRVLDRLQDAESEATHAVRRAR